MRALVLLFATLCSSFVSSVAQQSTATAPVKTGTLTGTVVDSVTNQPLRKAAVSLASSRETPEERSEPQKTKSVVTDDTGQFRFTDVKPGKYFVIAERAGYTTRRLMSQRSANIVNIAGGEEERTVVRLVPAAAISGQILDGDGEPLPDVVVQVLKPVYSFGKRDVVPMQFGKTNDLGQYRISPVPPGNYYVAAMRAKFASALFDMFTTGNFDRSDNDFEDGSLRYPPSFYPDAALFTDAEPLKVRAGQDIPINFTMVASSVFKVRGTITGLPKATPTGNPGAWANQSHAQLMLMASGQSLSLTALSGMTSMNPKDNSFEFASVMPGSYTLFVQGNSGGGHFQARVPVTVTAADVEGITVGMEERRPPIKIKGNLRAEGAPAVPEALGVQFMPMGRDSMFDVFESGGRAIVDKKGTFEISLGSAGSFITILTARGSGYEDWYTDSVRYAGRDVTGTRFDVGNEAATMDVVVRQDGARIQGRVVDEHDRPVPGASVIALPEAKYREWQEGYGRATTDQNGRFEMRGMRPGSYSVVASEELSEPDFLDPEIVPQLEQSGTSVKAQASGKYELNLKLLTFE